MGQQPGMGQQGMGQQGAPFEPPESPESSKKKVNWLRVAVPIVVVLAAAGFGVYKYFFSAQSAEAGDCLSVTEFAQDAEAPDKLDCGDQEANVKVAVKVDEGAGCPEGDYDEFSYEGGSKYCLMLNTKQGECIGNVSSPTEGYVRVGCDDPKAEVEVLEVVTGKSSPESCTNPETETGLIYTQPATVMCMKRVA